MILVPREPAVQGIPLPRRHLATCGEVVKRDLGQKIGLRVAALRRAAGLTQTALAEKAATTLDTIGRLERGVSLPGVEKLAVIAEVLGVQLWQLFAWERAPAATTAAAEVAAMVEACGDAQAALVRDVVARIVRG